MPENVYPENVNCTEDEIYRDLYRSPFTKLAHQLFAVQCQAYYPV